MTESKQYKAEESNKWGVVATDKPQPITISKFDILENKIKNNKLRIRLHEVDLYNLRQANRELKKQIKIDRIINVIYTTLICLLVFLLAIYY